MGVGAGQIKIIAVVGPTAVGKTQVAIELASWLGGEIVSADSMQIYKGMDIGTAKPDAEERRRAVHHMIDFADPSRGFSVAEYQAMARERIAEIAGRGVLPIIAGGTGLYVNAILFDMDFSATPKDAGLRRRYEAEAAGAGPEALHARLKAADPEAAARIHPNNVKKVIRALEILEGSMAVAPFSESFRPFGGYCPHIIGLTRDREELYSRIERRVDALIGAGLVEEVRGLYGSGVWEMAGGVPEAEAALDGGIAMAGTLASSEGIAMAGPLDSSEGIVDGNISIKGIGYKEIVGHLRGEYDLDHAISLIKRNSRRYAKRQLTWFRRYPDVQWFNLSEGEEAAIWHIKATLAEAPLNGAKRNG
ncbi:MAG: tRNA (adenosine(37)-N6)-dimethylallyltransferase MiaA [Clostridiales Family XIII bacterium]|jgi:tRNA dimethylallyltransferase|nr:tRNA (adenosine(37)-N6)-dimethylallyltransferase MiaA [Clostridiales Family XIII bacterium]